RVSFFASRSLVNITLHCPAATVWIEAISIHVSTSNDGGCQSGTIVCGRGFVAGVPAGECNTSIAPGRGDESDHSRSDLRNRRRDRGTEFNDALKITGDCRRLLRLGRKPGDAISAE